MAGTDNKIATLVKQHHNFIDTFYVSYLVPVPACVFVLPKVVAEKNVKYNSVCFSKSTYFQKKDGGFRCNSVEWNEKVIDVKKGQNATRISEKT
jgi:hypothetical protein